MYEDDVIKHQKRTSNQVSGALRVFFTAFICVFEVENWTWTWTFYRSLCIHFTIPFHTSPYWTLSHVLCYIIIMIIIIIQAFKHLSIQHTWFRVKFYSVSFWRILFVRQCCLPGRGQKEGRKKSESKSGKIERQQQKKCFRIACHSTIIHLCGSSTRGKDHEKSENRLKSLNGYSVRSFEWNCFRFASNAAFASSLFHSDLYALLTQVHVPRNDNRLQSFECLIFCCWLLMNQNSKLRNVCSTKRRTRKTKEKNRKWTLE